MNFVTTEEYNQKSLFYKYAYIVIAPLVYRFNFYAFWEYIQVIFELKLIRSIISCAIIKFVGDISLFNLLLLQLEI
jgi:hypothetical protein